MPFGLSNTSASFYCYINKILAEKLDVFVIVYLDDILIYTKNAGQAYINAVWWVFEELKNHGRFAKQKKCCFYKNKVHFLRYVMSARRVQIEKEKIKVIKNWSKPKSIYDI